MSHRSAGWAERTEEKGAEGVGGAPGCSGLLVGRRVAVVGCVVEHLLLVRMEEVEIEVGVEVGVGFEQVVHGGEEA